MRDIVTALARVAGGLVWLIPVLQCLTYHYGDGTYFRGTVDSTVQFFGSWFKFDDFDHECGDLLLITTVLVLHEIIYILFIFFASLWSDALGVTAV